MASVPFKVCCIKSVEEADMAVGAGALALGLVAEMPSGPGPISDETIREIARHVRERHGNAIWTVLLTSRTDGEAIAAHVADTGVNTVQIVDKPAPGAYDLIRKARPSARIMQVIHVEGETALDEARSAALGADVILLDSGRPNAAAKSLGGTGDVHDWSISRRIVDAVDTPVFLAGGLGPGNAREAIAAVRPFGLDLCSGLRDRTGDYALQQDKLSAFAAQLA